MILELNNLLPYDERCCVMVDHICAVTASEYNYETFTCSVDVGGVAPVFIARFKKRCEALRFQSEIIAAIRDGKNNAFICIDASDYLDCEHGHVAGTCKKCNPETCPHGNEIGSCQDCDAEGDLAFDAAREDKYK